MSSTYKARIDTHYPFSHKLPRKNNTLVSTIFHINSHNVYNSFSAVRCYPNDCEHECKVIGQNKLCYCYKGYTLGYDGRTCIGNHNLIHKRGM